jgi:hypothetical protein
MYLWDADEKYGKGQVVAAAALLKGGWHMLE